MKTFVFLLAFLSSPAFAVNAIRLTDGIYAHPHYCSLNIVTDPATGNLLAEDCAAPREWVLNQTNEYRSAKDTTLSAADIKKCTPTKADKKPCNNVLYDSKGAYIAQEGDVLQTSVDTVRVLTTEAIQWTFSGQALKRGTDIIAEDKSQAKTVLYVLKKTCN